MKDLIGYFGVEGNLGRTARPASIALRTGKHRNQHIDRQRVADDLREKTKRRNSIARASRRRNRG